MERRLYSVIGKKDAGLSMKAFLYAKWHLSMAMLTELKKREDGISVNGSRVTVRYILKEGDTVSISVGDNGADSGFEEWEIPLDILYEDSDIIVINKPPFLPVHPSKGHVKDTLANGLASYYHKKKETFVFRCVLRLDRNTSGAVLIAKNSYVHDMLRRQLLEGRVKKVYHALVHGRPPFHEVIDAPVYRPEEATVKRVVDPRGRSSVTEYFTEKSNGELSLLRVLPHTGRTHQIRLHLSYRGFPIATDFLYGNEDDGVLTRHGLHCSQLIFVHPVTNKTITVKAPLAPDMAEIAAGLPRTERYYSLDHYLRQTYGEKLAKLSLNAGLSCPNREKGRGGCSFCSMGGSGEFASPPNLTIPEQLVQAKALLGRKWKGSRYIAYFQSYTNTYGPVSKLRDLFMQAIQDPDVAALSVATRPDCLPDEVLALLCELNQIKPVWVELGLQTAHDETAVQLNRGYPRAVYEAAVHRLRSAHITVITHLIFGLPGEGKEEMLESAAYAGQYSDGIKLQMLQVLQGSSLGEEYRNRPFPLLSRTEYVTLVADAISILPPHVVVHRLTGDPPKNLLIAPQWTADKKRVMADLYKELSRRKLVQGCMIKK